MRKLFKRLNDLLHGYTVDEVADQLNNRDIYWRARLSEQRAAATTRIDYYRGMLACSTGLMAERLDQLVRAKAEMDLSGGVSYTMHVSRLMLGHRDRHGKPDKQFRQSIIRKMTDGLDWALSMERETASRRW